MHPQKPPLCKGRWPGGSRVGGIDGTDLLVLPGLVRHPPQTIPQSAWRLTAPFAQGSLPQNPEASTLTTRASSLEGTASPGRSRPGAPPQPLQEVEGLLELIKEQTPLCPPLNWGGCSGIFTSLKSQTQACQPGGDAPQGGFLIGQKATKDPPKGAPFGIPRIDLFLSCSGPSRPWVWWGGLAGLAHLWEVSTPLIASTPSTRASSLEGTASPGRSRPGCATSRAEIKRTAYHSSSDRAGESVCSSWYGNYPSARLGKQLLTG